MLLGRSRLSKLANFHVLSVHLGPHLLIWINFSPSMDKKLHHDSLWDKITYPFPNFNGTTAASWQWTRDFITNSIEHLSLRGLKLKHVSKRGPQTRSRRVHDDNQNAEWVLYCHSKGTTNLSTCSRSQKYGASIFDNPYPLFFILKYHSFVHNVFLSPI